MSGEKDNFEKELQNLEAAVDRLESGELSLEDAMSCFEEGVKAANNCARLLKNAELKVEQLLQGQDGSLVTEPFDHKAAAGDEDGSA